MRIWQSKLKGQLFALEIAAVICVFFLLGWYAGSYSTNRKACAALWDAIINLPDPEQCSLCSAGIPYHAPCLINLSTGQMGELKVYTDHPSRQGEIAPAEMQQTGTFSFRPCADLVAIQDTCTHTCIVTLPKDRELMNPALFCNRCRQLLAIAGLDGYVVVDLYNLDNVRAYPVQKGRSEVIRDYRISVSSRNGGFLDVYVTGLL